MNWYYGCSYNLQKNYVWIHICIWIHIVSVHTANQLTFEFILIYELILWSFIQLTTKGGRNSYMYMNSYDGRAYNQSMDIWIHINVWIDIMAVYTTYTQRTYEFIQVYEFILWSFVQPINGHLNSYLCMNWYYGHSYKLQTKYIWILICIWIHMMAVRTTYQRTFEFIIMYELILCSFILPKCKTLNGHMNSYVRSNETNLLMQ